MFVTPDQRVASWTPRGQLAQSSWHDSPLPQHDEGVALESHITLEGLVFRGLSVVVDFTAVDSVEAREAECGSSFVGWSKSC